MRTLSRLMLATLTTTSACAAFAQSDVRIYGRVNTSIERQTTGDRDVTAMINNNSRIGFIGTEDLGNGLKVGFKLEGGFKSDTGAGMLGDGGFSFGRGSNVNIRGGWGKIQLGRAGGSSYDYVADYGVLDQPNHDTGSVSDPLYQGVGRGTNGISYSTPTINGLTVAAGFSNHEKEGTQKNSFDLSANWELGAISLGAGYTKHGDNEQLGVRVHYTEGPYQIGAYYQRVEQDATGTAGSKAGTCGMAAGSACGSLNVARINAMYTSGKSEYVIGYGWTDDWGNQDNSSAKQLMLGYNYNLSKRTKVYALYTKIHNDANVKYGYGFHNTINKGEDARTFGVGLRHAF